jgi:hypothetical protein
MYQVGSEFELCLNKRDGGRAGGCYRDTDPGLTDSALKGGRGLEWWASEATSFLADSVFGHLKLLINFPLKFK